MDTKTNIKVNVEGASLTLAEKLELQKTLEAKVKEMKDRKYDSTGKPARKAFEVVKDTAKGAVKKISEINLIQAATSAAAIGVAAKAWTAVHEEIRRSKKEKRLQAQFKQNQLRRAQ